jgi:glycosyltransferase EpsD
MSDSWLVISSGVQLLDMPKILFVSNTANFSKFNHPFMSWFKQQGWQVDYAAPDDEEIFDCDSHYIINITRSPFSLQNIKEIEKLQMLINREEYNIIHCHTPMGAVIARLAAKKLRENGLKVIYTVHGFHFFRGASLFNWLIYYPIEKYLAHYTDAIITINQEDYNLSVKKIKIPLICKIDGVGINLEKFFPISNFEKNKLRKNFGYCDHDFILLYVAEFIPRKNHRYLLTKIPKLKKIIPNLKVVLAGKGILENEYKKMVQRLKMSNTIDFLGYRKDINNLCQISDIFVSPSLQEGLPIAVVEALASGLPIICSRIRGHIDIIHNSRNGFLFKLNKPISMIDSIIKLYNDPDLRYQVTQNNIQDAKKYSVDIAISNMADIYRKYMPSVQELPIKYNELIPPQKNATNISQNIRLLNS